MRFKAYGWGTLEAGTYQAHGGALSPSSEDFFWNQLKKIYN
jgi:hypothetical protein